MNNSVKPPDANSSPSNALNWKTWMKMQIKKRKIDNKIE